MLNYLPVPLSRVQLGKSLPVDIWSPDGRLLLRRGQELQSEQHREMLASHQACMTQSDAQAWQKSLERHMRQLYLSGADMTLIAQLPLPSDIIDNDYLPGHEVNGGWLDMQDVLRGLLYQGASAVSPLPRLEALERRALALMQQDPDDGLFALFQALPDLSLGYCATHGLLCGLVSALAAQKLQQAPAEQTLLLRSAMVMNIGMARLQDSLARQRTAPNAAQRQAIDDHAQAGVAMLSAMGVQESALLSTVLWHHAPELSGAEAGALHTLRLLNLTDGLIAKMAPRKTRSAMLPMAASKTLIMHNAEATASLRRALAAALGFYPPGSYVQLVNGETAVVVARGERANTPHVASIIAANGMPLGKYTYRTTSTTQFAVQVPLGAHTLHIQVNLEKVRHLRRQHGV